MTSTTPNSPSSQQPQPPVPADTKQPPDEAKIKALLDMAAMQSNVPAQVHSQFKPFIIMAVMAALVGLVLYLAVEWFASDAG